MPAAASTFKTIDISGANYTYGEGITDSGTVVGYDVVIGVGYFGFTDINGTVTTVNAPGGSATEVDGIGPAGQLVGNYNVGGFTGHGFESTNGTFTPISVSGQATYPKAVGPAGQVVGSYNDSNGVEHGFIEQNGVYTTVDVPGVASALQPNNGGGTEVVGIDSAGQIVGSYGTSLLDSHGFIETNGQYKSFDVPGAYLTYAEGVNAAGDITGYYIDNYGNANAFIYINGAFTLFDVPGARNTYAEGINASDQVVGYYVDSNLDDHGFVATVPTQGQPSTIKGDPGEQVDNDTKTITPFSGVPGLGVPFGGGATSVAIVDPNAGATDRVTITLTNGTPTNGAGGTETPTDANGKLSGAGLTETSTPGVYRLDATDAATLNQELDTLVFTPAAHEAAPGTLVATTFTIADTNSADPGETAIDSANYVQTLATDDAPVISGAKAGQTVTNNATIDPFAGVTISDPDVGVTYSATITLAGAGGTLSGAGLTETATAGTFSLAATDLRTLSTELDALTFAPSNGTPGTSGTTTFSLTVAQTGAGTLSTTDNTTSVIDTVAAQTSTISGAKANQATTDEVSIKPFANVTIADPNAAGTTDTVKVTFGNAANGSLSDPNQDGVFDNGTYIIQGSASFVTAGLRGLVFTPTAHQVAPGQTVTTTFTLSDQNSATFNFATFSAPTVSDGTTSVVATAVNDAPTISGAKANQATTNYASVKPFSGVSITDPDLGAQVSLTITVDGQVTGPVIGPATPGGGTLAGPGLSLTGTAGVYSLAAASPAALTAELDALTFTPADAAVPLTFQTTTFSLSAAQTAGGSTSTSTDSTTTVVNNVTAPLPSIVSGTQPGQVVTNASTIKPFSGAAITDPNGPYATDAVYIVLANAGGTATDANGALSGAGLTKTGTGAYKLTAGSAGAVTAELDSLVFTPTKVTSGSSVVTTFILYDVNSVANVAAADSATSVVATSASPPIVGRPAPSASIIAIPTADQSLTVTGIAALTPFAGASITDNNAGSPTETVTVTPSSTTIGTLADPSTASDGSSTSSNGAITLSGSASAVTQALDELTFKPAYGQSGPVSFTVTDKNSSGQVSTPATAALTVALPPAPTPVQLKQVGTDLMHFVTDTLQHQSTAADVSGLAGDLTALDLSQTQLGQLLGQALTASKLASAAATTLGMDIAALWYPKLTADLAHPGPSLATDLTKMVATTAAAATDDLFRTHSGQSGTAALNATIGDFKLG